MKKELVIKRCSKCQTLVEVIKDCTSDDCYKNERYYHFWWYNVEAVKFEDLPDDWFCPLFGLGKEFFEKIEE